MESAENATQAFPDAEVKSDERPATLGWSRSVAARPIGVGWDAEPTPIDWTGSGRVDLLVSSGGGPSGRRARIYRVLSPAGEFPPTYDGGTDVAGLDGLRGLAPIPRPDAARFDLVGLVDGAMVLARNLGTGDSPRFHGPTEPLAVDLEGQTIAQVAAIDWDGDGKVDLLVGLEDRSAYWPEPGFVAGSGGFNQRGGNPGYDAQGSWRGSPPKPSIRWLKNVGEPGAPAFRLEAELTPEVGSLDLEIAPAPLAVSWGGGNALEVLLSDRGGSVRLFRNFGGQRPPVLMEPRPLRAGGAPLALPDDRTTLQVADLDGDRRPELVFGAADGRVFAVHAGPGRDAALAPVPLSGEPGPIRLGGRAVVASADLDGDGGLDLIVGDSPGRLWLLKDEGKGPDHRYGEPTPIESGGTPFRLDPGLDGRPTGPADPALGQACPALVDWNRNGRPDLIVGGAGGELLFLKNDGSRTEPRFAPGVPITSRGVPILTPPRVRPAAGNWTGSGVVDLIAIDLQGFLRVYPGPGEGSPELGAPAPIVDKLGRILRLDGAIGQGGRVSLWAGDWTGSGRVDLLVGLPRDARHLVPGLLGKSFASLDAISTVLLLENLGDNVVLPRMIVLEDGSPLVIGSEGCSPSGVPRAGGGFDLLVGSDCGRIHLFSRSAASPVVVGPEVEAGPVVDEPTPDPEPEPEPEVVAEVPAGEPEPAAEAPAEPVAEANGTVPDAEAPPEPAAEPEAQPAD